MNFISRINLFINKKRKNLNFSLMNSPVSVLIIQEVSRVAPEGHSGYMRGMKVIEWATQEHVWAFLFSALMAGCAFCFFLHIVCAITELLVLKGVGFLFTRKVMKMVILGSFFWNLGVDQVLYCADLYTLIQQGWCIDWISPYEQSLLPGELLEEDKDEYGLYPDNPFDIPHREHFLTGLAFTAFGMTCVCVQLFLFNYWY